MNNPTQNNLLLAQEYGTQLETRLKYALDADEQKDEPELRPHLRKLLEEAVAFNKKLRKLREDYNDKMNDLPF